ncbi:MAG TPA: hypothetical protein VN720_00910, partial [Rudaea sp.]|nr:hypothetical protein [Rudaea sp.]
EDAAVPGQPLAQRSAGCGIDVGEWGHGDHPACYQATGGALKPRRAHGALFADRTTAHAADAQARHFSASMACFSVFSVVPTQLPRPVRDMICTPDVH